MESKLVVDCFEERSVMTEVKHEYLMCRRVDVCRAMLKGVCFWHLPEKHKV